MKCPKCTSENTIIQAKEVKPTIILGCCLALGGLGLMLLGIVGLIIGAVMGLIIGAILKAVSSTKYESVLICQDCGCTTKTSNMPNIKTHSLFCPPNESNFVITRLDETKGTVVNLRVWIDDEPFDMSNGYKSWLKLDDNVHTLKYEQTNGLDKKNRKGEFPISINYVKEIIFSFTRSGIKVNYIRNNF